MRTGEEKLLTRCHHDSAGPPLKSFLFDVDDGDDDDDDVDEHGNDDDETARRRLTPGARVELAGLSRAALNGQRATVVATETRDDAERAAVRLDASGKQVAIRRANLRALRPAAAAAPPPAAAAVGPASPSGGGGGGGGGGGRFACYARQTVRALEHVAGTFPGLRLHNRVAIVVPDERFRDALRPALRAALRARWPAWRAALVDAATASADLGDGPPPRRDSDGDGDGDGDGDARMCADGYDAGDATDDGDDVEGSGEEEAERMEVEDDGAVAAAANGGGGGNDDDASFDVDDESVDWLVLDAIGALDGAWCIQTSM